MLFYNRSKYNWPNNNSITGNAYINIEPVRNLRLRSSLGLNAWYGGSRSWSPTYFLASKFNNPNDGVSQSMYQGSGFTFTTTASYDLGFNNHKLTLLAGNEILVTNLDANVSGWKANSIFGDADHAYLSNVVAESISGISTSGSDGAAQGGGLVSYYGRLSYNFLEKYIFDATLRADGSSNFARGHRWGYFPSASAGWIFTEEDFMKGNNLINFGKLRASWGQNGNQSIPNFIYSSNIAYLQQGYYFGPDSWSPHPLQYLPT